MLRSNRPSLEVVVRTFDGPSTVIQTEIMRMYVVELREFTRGFVRVREVHLDFAQ